MGRTHGQEKLRAAVEQALALGCQDSAAVRHLLTTSLLERAAPTPIAVGPLAGFERPLPSVSDYDRLLVGLLGAEAGVR